MNFLVCPGLGYALPSLPDSQQRLPGRLSGQVGGKCDMVTQEEMSRDGRDLLVTLRAPMLSVGALPGSGAGPPLIHSFIHSTVFKLPLGQCFVSAGGWAAT